MSDKVFRFEKLGIFLLSVVFSAVLIGGCTVKAAKSDELVAKTSVKEKSSLSTIDIKPESPADTVRAFYKNLRERRFRDAIFLTNLRPAVEGLTDDELKDLQVDFESLARQVPADFEINGEIVSGDAATVTAKLPDNETGKIGLQEIKLRRDGKIWVIQTVDDEAEKVIKKEGKNYFFTLRMQTHHEEVKTTLERVMKAQMVYALQNGGAYADMKTLVEKNLLPADMMSAEQTGYKYKLTLSSDKKKYTATAEPTVYGKTGKLSFLLEGNGSKNPNLEGKDNKGQPLKK